jgi:5-methylcytosine-specific restriction endonuclease McrA
MTASSGTIGKNLAKKTKVTEPVSVKSARLKRGTVREDGKILWCYSRNRPWWVAPEKYAIKIKKALQSCKECYRRENSEQRKTRRAYQRNYYKNNPAFRKAHLARTVANAREKRFGSNREKFLAAEREKDRIRRQLPGVKAKKNERTKLKRAQNPDPFRKLDRDRYARDSEKRKKAALEWAARNPDKHNANTGRYRAVKKAAVSTGHNKKHDSFLWAAAKELSFSELVVVDHVIPLARGGRHELKNLRLLPWSLNARKKDRLDKELPEDLKNAILPWSDFSEALKKYAE